jgi:hypothetical protein
VAPMTAAKCRHYQPISPHRFVIVLRAVTTHTAGK